MYTPKQRCHYKTFMYYVWRLKDSRIFTNLTLCSLNKKCNNIKNKQNLHAAKTIQIVNNVFLNISHQSNNSQEYHTPHCLLPKSQQKIVDLNIFNDI